MTISLETISFNHDANSATSDALTIRRNRLQEVTVPEWKRGMTRPEESPAAYIASQISANRLTIQVTFRREANDPASVGVSAIGMTGTERGNVLGDVKPKTIHFVGDVLTAEFELASPPANPGVGRWDISWIWSLGTSATQTTNHRIYTTLDAPQEPWGQPGSSFALPWTDVLDHACLQAKGATNADEAAAKLTRWVNSLGDDGTLGYDTNNSGSSYFILPGGTTFKCTDFLRLLAGGTAPRSVNCSDCATILSSFANILGCELTQSKIGQRFDTNRIQLIGLGFPISTPFEFHEVAWEFPSRGIPSLYDCCLKVDGDANPADSSFSLPTLGIDTPLGTAGSGGYYFRLIARASNGNIPGEMEVSRVRRKIDGQATTIITLDPKQRRQLEKEYGFADWDGSTQDCRAHYKEEVVAQEGSTSGRELFLKNYSFEKALQPPAGWIAGDVEVFKAEPDPFRITEVVWRSKGCSGAMLRVLTYECSSVRAARSFLLTLLSEFNLPGIKRRLSFIVGDKPVKIGDVAFAGRDDLVVLFARANNVVLIQNVGRTLVPASQFGAAIDADMISDLDPKMEYVAEMNQFHVSDKEVRVGEVIRIHTDSKDVKKDKEPLLRFFTLGGLVFSKGDDLLYRPLIAGEQSITILAQQAEGKIARQVLKLAKVSAALYETKCTKFPDPDREVSVMPDFMGKWSSIRPQVVTSGPAELIPEGSIEITRRHPITGDITGSYTDSFDNSVQEIHGRVSFILPNSYRITLSHQVGVGVTRYYDGQLVAIDDRDGVGLQIVAGRFSDVIDLPEPSAAATTDSFSAASGQANGTWVATKP